MLSTGAMYDVAGREYWTARLSKDDGKTWKIVDSIIGRVEDTSIPTYSHQDKAGNIYAAGWWGSKEHSSSGTVAHLTTRISRDGGENWTFSDTFIRPEDESPNSAGRRLDSDGQTIYNFATLDEPGKDYYKYCTVRLSKNNGRTWENTGLKISSGQEKSSCSVATSSVIGDGHILMGGFFGNGPSFIYESKDRGETWDLIKFEGEVQLRAAIPGPNNTTLIALRSSDRKKISFKLLKRD